MTAVLVSPLAACSPWDVHAMVALLGGETAVSSVESPPTASTRPVSLVRQAARAQIEAFVQKTRGTAARWMADAKATVRAKLGGPIPSVLDDDALFEARALGAEGVTLGALLQAVPDMGLDELVAAGTLRDPGDLPALGVNSLEALEALRWRPRDVQRALGLADGAPLGTALGFSGVRDWDAVRARLWPRDVRALGLPVAQWLATAHAQQDAVWRALVADLGWYTRDTRAHWEREVGVSPAVLDALDKAAAATMPKGNETRVQRGRGLNPNVAF